MNVTLRPWTPGDAKTYMGMMGHVDFTYEDATLWPDDYRQAVRCLEDMEKAASYNGDFYHAVLLDGAVVGHVQVVRQEGVWSVDGHVGCLIVCEATGQGVGTEAVRQMVEMAFTRRDYNRLTAIVYQPNRASARVVEKLGFFLEATLRRAVTNGDGVYYDALVYGILRHDIGIPTTQCCNPEDELTPEEQLALEPTLAPLQSDLWIPINLDRFQQKDGPPKKTVRVIGFRTKSTL